jgi:pilin isopeptide linkage protein
VNTVKFFKPIALVLIAVLLAVGIIPSMAFATESSYTLPLQIENKISGDIPEEKQNFTFTLTPENASNPVPTKNTVTIAGEGTAQFDITYTEPGIYKYTLKEKDDGLSGYKYDNSVYSISVRVFYNDAKQLSVQAMAQKDDSSEKSSIVFNNKYTAPEPSTENPKEEETTPPSVDVTIKKVDSSGNLLSGAKLAIKDAKTGDIVKSWTSDGTAKKVELTSGKTYYLVEQEAPSGYLIAADVEFVVSADSKNLEVEMVDPKKESSSKLGSISVTKSIVLLDLFEDLELYTEDETYYVGLFTDAEGKHPYGSDYVKAIRIQQASHAEVVYSNLPEGTYYILETTKDGTPFSFNENIEVNGDACKCVVPEGTSNKVEIVKKTNQLDGTVKLINEYIDLPEGFAYRAMIDITKNVVFDGSQVSTDDTFYAGIFTSETEETPLIVTELSNNSTVAVEVPLGGESGDEEITYYIYETDADGNKIDKDSFGYVVTGEGEVSLDKSNTEASITITNEEKDETEYSEGSETDSDGNTIIESEGEPSTNVENESQNTDNNTDKNTNKNTDKNTGTTSSQTTTKNPISQIINSVVTGDVTTIVAYLLLLVAAGVGVTMIVRRKRK